MDHDLAHIVCVYACMRACARINSGEPIILVLFFKKKVLWAVEYQNDGLSWIYPACARARVGG